MKYIITGALGFIGLNLTELLLNDSENQIVIYDHFYGNYKLDERKLNLINSDRVKIASYDEIMDSKSEIWNQVNLVFHLGAIASTQASDKEIIENNIFFTRKLINVIAKNEEVAVIFASSAAVYGKNIDGAVMPTNTYGASKLINERDFFQSLASRSIGLRLFNVYGPGEEHKGNMKSVPSVFIDSATRNSEIEIFGVERNFELITASRDFIHVHEVVALIMIIADNFNNLAGRILDVGTSTSTSLLDLAKKVKEILPKTQIRIRPFPFNHKSYQLFTCANMDWLEELDTNGYSTKARSFMQDYLETSIAAILSTED